MSVVPRGRASVGLSLAPTAPAKTHPPPDAINIERAHWPSLPSYSNSVRTKVNALNLISVLIRFNGVVMQGGVETSVGGGWGRQREIGNQQGARTEAKLITGLHKFDVMSHFP